MYLVSVDPMDRSKSTYFWVDRKYKDVMIKVTTCKEFLSSRKSKQWVSFVIQNVNSTDQRSIVETSKYILSAFWYVQWFLKIKILRRSASNLRKISGPANLDFFFSLSPGFFSDLWYKSSFFFGEDLKKILVCRTWNFFMVWRRPWFFKTLIFRNQGAD